MMAFRFVFKKLWDSPTFNSWGNHAVQSLRLFLVTPLLVTRFDQTEIAAWYLFASLNFLGAILSSRFVLSFSRMFAFAMAGNSDLSALGQRPVHQSEANPDWHAFSRAYGTLGVLLLGVAACNMLTAAAMGAYGLGNLTADYSGGQSLWLCFTIMLVGQFVLVVYKRYTAALVGMNYVALNARWGMVFSLLSVLAGSLTLWLGGGLLSLIVVMQLTSLLTPLRMYFLLNKVESGRVASMVGWRWDREAFFWALGPTWKGFLTDLGVAGTFQVVGVLYTGVGASMSVASFLLSLRLIEFAALFATTPYTSIQPKLSRMWASGELDALVEILRQRFRVVLVLLGGAMLAGILVLPPLFSLIGANVELVPANVWLVLGGLLLVLRFIFLNVTISALGNDYPFWMYSLGIFVMASVFTFAVGDGIGIWGPCLAVAVPAILVYNVQPILSASAKMKRSMWRCFGRDFVAVLSIYSALTAVILVCLYQ